MAVDIAKGKGTEEDLEKCPEIVRAIFQVSPLAIMALDYQGTITMWNPAAERIFGWSRHEVLGRPIPMVPPDKKEDFWALLKRGLDGESFKGIELRRRKKDGSPIDVSLWTAPLLNAQGTITCVMAVIVDNSERKRAEEVLHQLSGRLLRLQDEERRRMARDLHDTTAQNLAILIMNLSLANESAAGLEPRMHGVLSESLTLAKQCAREIRTLSYLLHPPLLDELGLPAAVSVYAQGFTERSGIRIDLEVPPDMPRLPDDMERTLFRIVQESLTNVHRHSGSSTAWIGIALESDKVTLEVKDKGRGMLPSTLERMSQGSAALGVGIAGMWERARQLSGRLEITSGSQGTTVKAVLPLPGGKS